jgi:hypothetical protein
MSVRVDAGRIHLEGDCPVEDAEALSAALAAASQPCVELSLCRHLHGAVVQAMLVFRPEITGIPMNGFTAAMVLPALTGQPTQSRALDGPDAISFHQ